VDSGFGDTSHTVPAGRPVNVSPTNDMELAVEDQAVGQGATPKPSGHGRGTTWLMARGVQSASGGGGNAATPPERPTTTPATC